MVCDGHRGSDGGYDGRAKDGPGAGEHGDGAGGGGGWVGGRALAGACER